MKKALFALLAIALLVLVAGCAKKEAPAAPVEPQPEPVVTETKPATTPTVTTPTTTALLAPLSGAVCEDGKISVVVTNVQDVTWDFEDIKVYLNAGIDKEPGCDKTELKPGESTTCDSIDWPLVVKSPKKNIVQVVVPGERYSVEGIVCE